MQFQTYVIQYIKRHPINSLFLMVNTIFFITTLLTGGFNVLNLIELGAIFPPFVIESGEYYRLITGMFLHGNVFHFLMNMYALFYLGGHMELMIGPRKYILLYIISGLVASIAVVFLGSYNTVTVGASGSIFGVMGGLFILTLIRQSWFNELAIRSIRNLMIINLIVTFLVADISVLGHIGGLVAGTAFLYIFTPKRPHFLTSMYRD